MLYTPKVYHVTLGVSDPINFAANKESEALHMLRAEYQGRCFLGAYICRVDALLEAGAIRINTTNTTGEATVDVAFRATVVVVAQGDVLAGAVVVADAQQFALCAWEGEAIPRGAAPKASITIVSDASGARGVALRQGWRVALRVLVSTHDPFSPHIVIVGTLLSCEVRPPSYRLAGVLDVEAAEALAPTAAAIAAERARRAARPPADAAAVADFDEALRARAAPAAPGQADHDIVALVDAAARGEKPDVSGVWGRPPGCDPFSPAVARAPGALPGCSPPVAVPAVVAFGEMARDVLALHVASRVMGAAWSAEGSKTERASIVASMRAAQGAA